MAKDKGRKRAAGQELLEDMREHLRTYLSAGLHFAHRCGGVDPDAFWRGWILVQTHIARLEARGSGKWRLEEWEEQSLVRSLEIPPMPEDPYASISLQDLLSYLEYGHLRARKTDESFCFYETFPPRFGEIGVYLTWLDRMRTLTAPEPKNSAGRPDWQTFVQLASDLTECLDRNPDWRPPEMEAPVLYWSRMQQECQRVFREEFCLVERLGQAMNPEDTKKICRAVESGARELGFQVEDGRIFCKEDPRSLMFALRLTAPVARVFHPKYKGISVEAVLPNRRYVLNPGETPEQPRWGAMSRGDRYLLEKRGSTPRMETDLLTVLVSNFVILVDDTLLTDEMSMSHIANLLQLSKGKKIAVHAEMDLSAISSVYFRQKAIAEVEPSVFQDVLTQAEKTNLEQVRAELQVPFGPLLRTVYMGEIDYGLRITSARSESGIQVLRPWEALLLRAESSPETRFLVFTRDRRLARVAQRARFRNLVAVTMMSDDSMLFLQETWPVYCEMLRGNPGLPGRERRKRPPVPKEADGLVQEEVTKEKETFAGGYPKWVEDFENAYNGGRNICNGPEITPDPDLKDLQEVHWKKDPEPIVLERWFTGESGGVYAMVEGSEDRLACLFLKEKRNPELICQLKQMLMDPPGVKGVCWPESLLRKADGKVVGYVMPMPDGMELNNMILHSGMAVQGLPRQNWDRLMLGKLALALARIVEELEWRGILPGGPNPHSIRFNAKGEIFLLDCERFQIGEDAVAPGPELFLPPEILKEVLRSGELPSHVLWTPEGQDWALAVLLFQILMLGRAPFESRSGSREDLLEGICAGHFIWDVCGRELDARKIPGPMRPPVGRWRNLWLSTPDWVRKAFTETFTGQRRWLVSQWCMLLEDYVHHMESGMASRELFPDVVNISPGSPDPLTGEILAEAVCRDCRKEFCLPEREKKRLMERRQPLLCDVHRQMRQNFQRRFLMVVCPKCGTFFYTDTATWMGKRWGRSTALCRKCSSRSVLCEYCGKTVPVDRRDLEDFKKRGLRAYCSEACFEASNPRVMCSCGVVFRIRRKALERLQRDGRPALCPTCRTQMMN